MKYIFFLCSLLPVAGKAQELFTFTEPASNMAAKGIGIRMNNFFMKEAPANTTGYRFIPGIMVGISKRIMVHGEAFFSNSTDAFGYEGAGVYMKYRFYSIDEVHSHFRAAAYGRVAYNKSAIQQPAIDFAGYNSGYEGGLVATKLINKVALSGSGAFLHASDNGKNKFSFADKYRNAAAYTFSIGKLLLPKEYVNYEQTNLNAMIELLGQTNLAGQGSYIDLAPSLQFIILSKMRVDIGYRFALVNELERTTEKGFLVRLEYNFFNAF
jgi:hypothetical protein